VRYDVLRIAFKRVHRGGLTNERDFPVPVTASRCQD
jgi:hypothetical protein